MGWPERPAGIREEDLTAPKRVLVFTFADVGSRMASPAMRMWEICRVLGQHCEVVLMSANTIPTQAPGFRLVSYSRAAIKDLGRWADVVVVDQETYRRYPRVGRFDRPLAIDLTYPTLIENLELKRQWESLDAWQQSFKMQFQRPEYLEPLRRGDFFFTASPRQRDFNLGLLTALGRVNPLTYYNDLELRQLIEVIPFGVPTEPPQHTQNVLRGVVPGIDRDDFLLLWAGGVWAWFDPWTLLEAMARMRSSLPRVKLYFMGITPPHPEIRWFPFNDRLLERARRLGVLDRNVFINTGWVEYHDRANYLVEADVGITTQAAHLETHLAVRTRAFDYIWGGLPLLMTTGDWLSDWAERTGLGLSIPPHNVGALVEAIRRLAEDEPLCRQMRERVREQAREWTWERVSQPLVEFCLHPFFAADRTFREKFDGKPRWRLEPKYHWTVLRRSGFKEFLRSFESLLPLRRIRVAFRDEGLRAGFRALRTELRFSGPVP